MIRLTTKQVISIHSSLIEATGGTDGVRDMGMLESALEAQFTQLNTIEKEVVFHFLFVLGEIFLKKTNTSPNV